MPRFSLSRNVDCSRTHTLKQELSSLMLDFQTPKKVNHLMALYFLFFSLLLLTIRFHHERLGKVCVDLPERVEPDSNFKEVPSVRFQITVLKPWFRAALQNG